MRLALAPKLGLALAVGLAVPASGEGDLLSALEAGWHGEKICHLLHETDTHRVLQCTFPPGVGHERHFHPAHFGYALSGGRMRITDAEGTREVELATGSHYASAGTRGHEVLNVGTTPVIYLIVEER